MTSKGVELATPYTLGIWHVRPGHADDFVEAWTEFADLTVEQASGSGWGRLLRDMENPDRFISVGPWESLAAIEGWRALDGFRQRVGRIRQLLVSFEPATLECVAERG